MDLTNQYYSDFLDKVKSDAISTALFRYAIQLLRLCTFVCLGAFQTQIRHSSSCP